MRRRRVSRLLASLAAMLLASVALLGTLSALAAHPRALPRGLAALRATATSCARPLGRIVLPAAAIAGEVLDFKPVPRESVTRFERMRIVHRTPAPDPTDTMSFDRAFPATPPAAGTPETPDAPDAPEAPDTPTERSGGITRIGSDIHIGRDEVVHGDVVAVSGDITVEGHVEGDVNAVKGDVDLKPTARVDGDVTCFGGTLDQESGAQIGGQRATVPGPGSWRMRGTSGSGHGDSEKVARSLVWLLVLALLGWVFVRMASGRTQAGTETLAHSPGLSLGIGSLVWALIIPSLIALVLVVALLCITIIGIPLALAALFGYFIFLGVLAVWGFVVGAIAVGGAIARSREVPGYAGAGMPPGAASFPGVAPAGAGVARGASHNPLVRPMLIGIGVLQGSVVLGRLLQSADLGPVHGLGTLLVVLGIVAGWIAMTVGAGALMRSEIVTGTFQRLWSGRRWGNGGSRGAGAAPPVAPGPPMPPPPPGSAAPWWPVPPASYTPPGQDPAGGASPQPPPPPPPPPMA